MTILRQLLTSKKNVIEIKSDDQSIINHFSNSNNYADVVLNMFNNDRVFDPIFHGWENITVLDIGANIGLFSLYISDRAANVIAVEPTPAHYNILCKLTSHVSNIKPLNMALSDTTGPVEFYISHENSTMNSIVNQYGEKIKVPGVTIEDLLNTQNLSTVDFVKCDIEGSEVAAITENTIKPVANRIRVWNLEVHATDKNLNPKQSLDFNRDKLSKIFENVGYKTVKYRYDGLYVYR